LIKIYTLEEEGNMPTEKFITIWDDVKWELEKIERDGYDDDWYYEDNDSPIDEKLAEIIEELSKNTSSKSARMEFTEEALSYIMVDGFEDKVYKAIHSACYDKDELLYLAQQLEDSSKSWMKDYAKSIYNEIKISEGNNGRNN
jgi:hypothetical protein